MPRAKTRWEAATSYAGGVAQYVACVGGLEHYIERAFIDGAKWQKNRANKRALRKHNAAIRAAEGKSDGT